MTEKAGIGALLLKRESEVQIGFIRYDRSGMHVYQVIKPGLHANEFRAIHHLLANQWLSTPCIRSILDG